MCSSDLRFGARLIFERTVAFAATQIPGDRYTPHPATWFNQHRFNDDPETWQSTKMQRRDRSEVAPVEESLRPKYRPPPGNISNDEWVSAGAIAKAEIARAKEALKAKK